LQKVPTGGRPLQNDREKRVSAAKEKTLLRTKKKRTEVEKRGPSEVPTWRFWRKHLQGKAKKKQQFPAEEEVLEKGGQSAAGRQKKKASRERFLWCYEIKELRKYSSEKSGQGGVKGECAGSRKRCSMQRVRKSQRHRKNENAWGKGLRSAKKGLAP